MLKDFKNDDQSNSGIVRFSRLVMRIPRLRIFTSSLSFYLQKKKLWRFHNKDKKTDSEVLSKLFAFFNMIMLLAFCYLNYFLFVKYSSLLRLMV